MSRTASVRASEQAAPGDRMADVVTAAGAIPDFRVQSGEETAGVPPGARRHWFAW